MKEVKPCFDNDDDDNDNLSLNYHSLVSIKTNLKTIYHNRLIQSIYRNIAIFIHIK